MPAAFARPAAGALRRGAAMLLAVLLAACTGKAPPPVVPPLPPPTQAADGTTIDPANPSYIIGPGDGLSIFVYDAPQLSMGVVVRPDGRISTPLIQDLPVTGKTPSQLASDIAEKLKEFVKDPNVTVIVTGFIGPFDRQVRVIGEAAEPQAIPYREHMTLLDVMIITHGLTKFASGNSAIVVRRVGDKREIIKVRLADLIKDGDIDQNIDLLPGDTLIIPQSWF